MIINYYMIKHGHSIINTNSIINTISNTTNLPFYSDFVVIMNHIFYIFVCNISMIHIITFNPSPKDLVTVLILCAIFKIIIYILIISKLYHLNYIHSYFLFLFFTIYNLLHLILIHLNLILFSIFYQIKINYISFFSNIYIQSKYLYFYYKFIYFFKNDFLFNIKIYNEYNLFSIIFSFFFTFKFNSKLFKVFFPYFFFKSFTNLF